MSHENCWMLCLAILLESTYSARASNFVAVKLISPVIVDSPEKVKFCIGDHFYRLCLCQSKFSKKVLYIACIM